MKFENEKEERLRQYLTCADKWNLKPEVQERTIFHVSWWPK